MGFRGVRPADQQDRTRTVYCECGNTFIGLAAKEGVRVARTNCGGCDRVYFIHNASLGILIPNKCAVYSEYEIAQPPSGDTTTMAPTTYAQIGKQLSDSLDTMGQSAFTYAHHEYAALCIAFRNPQNAENNLLLVLDCTGYSVFNDCETARIANNYASTMALIDVTISAEDLEALRTGAATADDLFTAGKTKLVGDIGVISSLGTVFEKLFV